MIVYISMFLYIFFVGVIGNAYVQRNGLQSKYPSGISLLGAILVLAMPVFFIGMRTNYIDTVGYLMGFDFLETDWASTANGLEEAKGSGWIIYQWIIKRFITTNSFAFLMITAVIQAGALLKLYYKYSINFSYSILLFFLSCSFTNMMNGIRQFMALSLILYFADYIFEKQYGKFIIVVIVASLIHISAIIWLPAIFLVQGKPWNKKMVLLSALTLMAIVFLDNFTDILEDVLENTAYAGYTSQFAVDDGSNITHTLIAMVPLVIAYWGRGIIYKVSNVKANIMINVSLFGVMVSLLANFTSGILIGRMPIYFTVFNYALLPWLFENVFHVRSKRWITMLCLVGYIAYAVYYMKTTWGSRGMPYISDILGINTWR